MKANKKHLTNQIESILADGICDCEEIDITSEKLVKLIWPYFQYYDEQNKDYKYCPYCGDKLEPKIYTDATSPLVCNSLFCKKSK